MENNRTYDVSSGMRDTVAMPSGLEVESARLHMPSDGGQHISGMTHSGWREKLDTMKSRSLSTLTSARSTVMSRVTAAKPVAQRGVDTVRSGIRGSMMKVQNNLRMNPAKWAGIAMGAGFTAGLLGRIKLHRSLHRSMPEVLVISAAC